MKISRITILTLGVADLGKATAFYEAVLGTPPNKSADGITLIELPGAWIALYPVEALAEDITPGIALNRLHGMLKPGGLLYIHDVIFAQTGTETNIARWIDQLSEVGGKHLLDDVATHVREEFSTYDWIMDGLLERAGFEILSKEMASGVIGTYLCQKEISNCTHIRG